MLKRGLDPEIAAMSAMLHDLQAYRSGSYDDKYAVDDPMDELLKDADVMHHTLNDTSKSIKEKEQKRYDDICRELGLID